MSPAFEARDFITGESFGVVACGPCGTGATDPIPANLDPYYPAEQYRRFSGLVSAIMKPLYRAAVRKWVGAVSLPAGRARSVLEVGAGNGWMLATLREMGWNVFGFERNPEHASRIERETGVPMLSGELSQLKSGTGNAAGMAAAGRKFDLIILFNVIEHLPDPAVRLRECAELLADDGMMVLNAPCFGSWQARFGRANWAHLDVPRHLTHFTRAGFKAALAQAGLFPRVVRYGSWVHDPYGWVVTLLNRLGFERNRLTRELMKGGFGRLMDPSGLALLFVGALLSPIAIVLAVVSWIFSAGALIELWAGKQS